MWYYHIRFVPYAVNMPLSTTLLTTKIFATMALSAAAAGNSNLRLHHRVGNNAVSSSSLLQKARPFSSRKLEDSANTNQQPSIKFSSCVDMKLLPDEYTNGGADDTILSYVKSGKLMSTKSYVLFYMCNGDTCNEDDLYIVDIGTYTKNIASYFVNYEDGICRACNQYADYCNSNDDGSSSSSSYSSYGNNNNYGNNNYYGNRELKNFDCDECDQYNCFSTNYNYVYNEDVNDLIDDISECLRTGSEMNGEDLYVGPMCSASGDGVELAIFMDDKCSEYTTQKAFADLPGYFMYQSPYVFNITKDAFQKAFSDSVSCDDLDISSPYNGNYNYNNGYGGMNDYCKQVLNEGVGLSSCYGNNNYNGNQNNGNDNGNQNNGNYYNQGDDGNYYNQGDDVLSWYDYDIAYDDAKDIDQVCSAVYEMAGSYSNYYDSSKSGSWYKKSKSSSIKIDMDVNEETAAAALGLLFFSVGALAAGFYLYKKQKAKDANEKLQPLQENEKGVMT